MIDVKEIRKDFPFFDNTKLAYLDNSATSQRPRAVVEAVADYEYYHNSNPFRGLYELSIDATDRYEAARKKVADFVNAASENEIIFTRNASESLNLVAYSLSEMVLNEGDEIITTVVEHHSNMLPWRLAAKKHNATIKYLKVQDDGSFDIEDLKALLSPKTKIVAMTAMSNVYGRVIDIKAFAKVVHDAGAYFVVDGAQSVPHSKTDVQDLDVDFLAFSGHKMLAPMGIGVLYGKLDILEKMPPFLSGGEMIEYVTFDDITFAHSPHRFEAGTVNAGGAIGLAAAIDYIQSIGIENIANRELSLTKLALDEIKNIPHVTVLGSDKAEDHHGIITFKIDGVHPHDIAAIMADNNVAVRAGHHCAEPLHHFIEIPSTTRASIMFYNTEDEVMQFVNTLKRIRPMMGYED
ncbi:MAG: SufS family cysteine desulfurase [Pseudobutyrivibrio sp.]|uniref:aminotransferase class V-fold PLP-dependent enzyme n=1 Tax=Pseudobutyrivibrio sp. TaxID=2014367 RepID=UPI0025D98425|nr:SufS family cysteine desulfurase [Pseudobutyrivibrio sp.]MBQ8490168.1 SufS family cysteine desulfurase [Pseudobutyrivibrio sp.]